MILKKKCVYPTRTRIRIVKMAIVKDIEKSLSSYKSKNMLTIIQLAQKLGVHHQTIFNWLHGKNKRITQTQLEKLIKFGIINESDVYVDNPE